MDMTLVEHMWIAVAIQSGLAGLLGVRGAGVAAVMVFLGREIAQNEFEALRLPEYVDMNLASLPWWAGLRHGWGLGSVLDVAAPALACCLTALLWRAWRWWRHPAQRKTATRHDP